MLESFCSKYLLAHGQGEVTGQGGNPENITLRSNRSTIRMVPQISGWGRQHSLNTCPRLKKLLLLCFGPRLLTGNKCHKKKDNTSLGDQTIIT